MEEQTEKRATYLIKCDLLDNIDALATYRRVLKKEIVSQAIKYYMRNQADLKDAWKFKIEKAVNKAK
jgi:hypothetical protein